MTTGAEAAWVLRNGNNGVVVLELPSALAAANATNPPEVDGPGSRPVDEVSSMIAQAPSTPQVSVRCVQCGPGSSKLMSLNCAVAARSIPSTGHLQDLDSVIRYKNPYLDAELSPVG